MNTPFKLIVVIPCFNEEKRLNLNTWFEYISSHTEYNFLFVDDGSNDNTYSILEELNIKYSNIAVLRNDKNLGKSAAVRNGILHAHKNFQFDFIAFIDADLSTPLTELDRFLFLFNSNKKIDFILGSRVQMLGKNINRNLFRHYIGRIIATFICKILDEPVYDTQCGLKMLKKDLAIELVNDTFISKWLFDVEMLARYKSIYGSALFKENLLEVPVLKWTEKSDSRLKYYEFLKIITELRKIKKRYFRTYKI